MRLTPSYDENAANNYLNSGLQVEGGCHSEGGKITAIWEGKTAIHMGLHGKKVIAEDFSAIAGNKHHETKKQLTPRNSSTRRAGLDATFSASKSVSLLFKFSGNKDILKAHQKACRAAMSELEKYAQTQHTAKNKTKYREDTSNILYARYDHFLSRPVLQEDGKTFAPSPQIHSHCFIMPVTISKEQNRYRALEMGNIYAHSDLFEAIYQSTLSYELQQLGYAIERTKNSFEVVGIGKEIRDKFSERTKEIEAKAKELGITNKRALGQLGAKTRAKKSKQTIPESELLDFWKSKLTPEELQTIEQVKSKSFKPKQQKVSAKEVIDKSLNHWLERNSGIQEHKVVAYALRLSFGQLRLDDIREELSNRKEIRRTNRYGVEYITTEQKVIEENRMIRYVVDGKSTLPPLNDQFVAKNKILNKEQRNAVQTILRSNDFATLLRGVAGSGKTTLMQSVKAGIEEKGGKLIAVAPTSLASKKVMREKGFEGAETIAALIKSPKLQQQLKDAILWADESSMIATKTMNKLLRICKQQNARIILSGDARQHGSIEAGSAQFLLEKYAKIKTAQVDTIIRQKPENYRKAIEQLSRGETLKGYKSLEQMGAVKEIEDQDLRMQQITEDYIKSVQAKRSALVVSPTHAEKDLLSENIRIGLKDKNILKGKERMFNTMKPLSMTEQERQDTSHYQKDQYIRFVQNTPGFRAGQLYQVEPIKEQGKIQVRSMETKDVVSLPLEKAKNFQVYEPTTTPVCVGETIAINANSKTMEGSKLHNQQRYTVTGFDKAGNIKLSNKKTLDRDFKNFSSGYVISSHASQGQTAKDVFISQSSISYAASNQKQLYVSASRGSERIQLYTDDKEELKKAVVRNADQISAIEIEYEDRQRRMQEQQRRQYYPPRHQQTDKSNLKSRNKQQDYELTRSIQRKGLERE